MPKIILDAAAKLLRRIGNVSRKHSSLNFEFDRLCYEFSDSPLVVSTSAFVIPSGWGGIAAARSTQTRHSIPSAFGPL